LSLQTNTGNQNKNGQCESGCQERFNPQHLICVLLRFHKFMFLIIGWLIVFFIILLKKYKKVTTLLNKEEFKIDF
jgi:uncharacterized membrane protein